MLGGGPQVVSMVDGWYGTVNQLGWAKMVAVFIV